MKEEHIMNKALLSLLTVVLATGLAWIGCSTDAGPLASGSDASTSDERVPLAKKGGDSGGGGGKGGGKGETSGCQITFDATFDDAPDDKVRSDGMGPYQDGEQKVIVFTGSGPGFRLDTNSSQKLEGAKGFRELCMDFTGTGLGLGVECSGGDLRFSKFLGGLDLCALDPAGGSGEVGLDIHFALDSGETRRLSYDCRTPDGDPVGSTVPVTVTRLDEFTWTVEGETACLSEPDGYFDPPPDMDDLSMPFRMTLVDQSASP